MFPSICVIPISGFHYIKITSCWCQLFFQAPWNNCTRRGCNNMIRRVAVKQWKTMPKTWQTLTFLRCRVWTWGTLESPHRSMQIWCFSAAFFLFLQSLQLSQQQNTFTLFPPFFFSIYSNSSQAFTRKLKMCIKHVDVDLLICFWDL